MQLIEWVRLDLRKYDRDRDLGMNQVLHALKNHITKELWKKQLREKLGEAGE